MASGDTLATFTPHHAEYLAMAFPQFDLRNNHPVLDYDDTTNEAAAFSAVMPRNLSAGGGITAYLHWAATSAVVGDVDWDVAFERIGDGIQDIDADGFAAAQSADNNVVPGTSGHVEITAVPFTNAQADSIVAGEGFRVKVMRDGINDTASGDAELLFVELKET
jgi:hypothetical protein